MSKARVYLSLGTNIDRERYMRSALNALSKEFGELVLSRVYESEAIGFEGDSFYNMVVGIDTELSISALSQCLKDIEDSNGRDRTGPKFSSRTLDIDILTYNDLKGEIEGIVLPRPEVYEHAFVLWPLAEVAGDMIDPKVRKSYSSLWQEFSADQNLHPITFDWQPPR